MSSSASPSLQRRALLPGGEDCRRLVRVALLVPLTALLAAVVALTLYCRSLLADAAAGEAVVVGDASLVFVAGGFLLASAAVVAMQSLRVAARVSGPEYRLCTVLRRIRTGEPVGHVKLRRGDLLGDLAKECNELIDWLEVRLPAKELMARDVIDLAAAETRVVATRGAREFEDVAP